MSKSTVAVILVSPARVGPWGDNAWRFSGGMQLVSQGPDWLHAQWTTPGEQDTRTLPLASMTLRDTDVDRAQDIAVMALAIMQVAGWGSLTGWWETTEERSALLPELERIMLEARGQLKLAVIDLEREAVAPGLVTSLLELGFEVVRYAQSQ